jgi:UDP-N-acetylglucosamine acyltransferase
MAQVHPTAIVNPDARLGENVTVGPFCIIGPHVRIGDNTTLYSHVVMDGHTTIGKNNQFFQFCSIGAPPQDTSYKGEPTRVEVGDNNIFRECVTIHRGTLKQDQLTKIGNNCFFMAYVHVGHDGTVGNNVTLVNSVNLAGHVTLGDRVIIGGGTNIGQFVTLGRGSYIGGGSGIDKDIPPFCTAYGNRIRLKGINIIGMRRQGHSREAINEVVDFYRTMEASTLSPRSFVDHEEYYNEYKNNTVVQEIITAIKKSEVGIAPFMA